MRHRRTPRTTPAVPPSFRPWPAIALLIVSTCVDVAWGVSGCILVALNDDEQEQEESRSRSWRTRLDRHLRAMSSGTTEDRMEAIEEADELLDRDGEEDVDDPTNPTPDEIAGRLIDFIETEPDEWMSWNLLDTLEYDEGEAVLALFRAALQSSSPTLRAKALIFYSLEEDPLAAPLLEALWDDGVPGWAIPDLMLALANQGSTKDFPDFLRRTGDPDALVRLGAIAALADLLEDEALPRLVELTRAEDRLTRGAAIEALGGWSDSEAAAEALVEAIHSDPVWGIRALEALGKMKGPVADARLLGILSAPHRPDFWVRAALELVDSDLPDTDAALVQALDRAARLDLEDAVHGLLAALHNRDSADAVPGLVQLDPGIGGRSFLNLRGLIGYLDRDRSRRQAWRIAYDPVRRGAPPEDEQPLFHVIAEGVARSVRCWQGPDVAFEAWLLPRIPENATIGILGYFDRGGETWALLAGTDASGCWIPFRLLAEGDGPGPTAPDPRRRELDVPAAAVRNSTARALVKAGTIELLDDGDETAAGIAVNLRDDGPDLREVLERLKSATRLSVEDHMEDLLLALERQERKKLEAAVESDRNVVTDP